MLEFWKTFFSAGSFIPHGHCYLWKPPLVWLHVTSDTLTALAYYSIPITLFYFVNKRKDLPFHGIFLLFCAFIVACGTTHIMEVWTLWHPTYWLSGAIKASTAAVSVLTALELIPVIPQALALPSPAQLEKANQELQIQIAERLKAEKDLKKYQIHLEQRVAERTAELKASNRQMEELLEREQQARAQAEAATIEIQRYAERLTLALEAAKMGSWDWDIITDEILWTPHHEIIFGYEPGQPKRSYQEWQSRVHPEDLPQVEAAMNTALTNRQELDCQYRLLLPNGQLRWVDAFGRASYDLEGRPVRMVGMVTDVTERKLAEESLRQSEEMARRQLAEIEAIYATAPIGLCVLDTEFRFVRLNEFLAHINGLSVAEHLGRKIQEILPELAKLQEPMFEQVLQSGQPVLNFEVHGETLAESKTERDWLVNYYPLRGIDGQVLGINITVQEITDRKLVEKELQQRAEELSQVNTALAETMSLLQERNQELAQFAYVVSHDLKAPLRAIANLSTWIEEDVGERLPEDNQQQLQLLRKRVYRMEALIDGLLQYSRVGRTQANVETFLVDDLLAEVIDSLAPPDTFTIKIEPGMERIVTKRLLLNQVFSNLISNAIKHHDRSDGIVKISMREYSDCYEFTVSDDGPGIDSRYHQQIFAIFQTLKSRDEQENTGVGLAIVKKIIETEGGSISIESKLGDGTIFRFVWPKQSSED